MRLFSAALWSPAGNGLTSWLLFVMFNCVFVTSLCGILGQVFYLIVSIPDFCRISTLHQNTRCFLNFKKTNSFTLHLACVNYVNTVQDQFAIVESANIVGL